jgi:hypothetical protein
VIIGPPLAHPLSGDEAVPIYRNLLNQSAGLGFGGGGAGVSIPVNTGASSSSTAISGSLSSGASR